MKDGNISLKYGGVPPGGTAYYGAPLGSACLRCGHVLLFLSGNALERLRRDAATLRPVPSP